MRSELEKAARAQLPGLDPVSLNSFLSSLLRHGYHLATGGTGLQFDYEPVPSGPGWRLQLGGWATAELPDPAAARAVANLHRSLAAEFPGFKALPAARSAVQRQAEAVVQFQLALSPDAQLRKLIAQGHCELCPWLGRPHHSLQA